MSLAALASKPPRARSYEVAHAVAARLSPKVGARFVAAVDSALAKADAGAIRRAIAAGDPERVVAAIPELGEILAADPALHAAFVEAQRSTGRAGAKALGFGFSTTDPHVIGYARQQVAQLVVEVNAAQVDAIRLVSRLAAERGISPIEQSRVIREVVGLPSVWADAPMNLADELRAGHVGAATSRRLSAATKAEIRSRIKSGTVTEDWVRKMRRTYAESLVNRRAQNIARTETLDAANAGLRESWRQAQAEGYLPDTARRVPIVTPDDKLRATHLEVVTLNPGGVPIGVPYQTPWGARMGPPWETNCRCGEGLIFPGRRGIL